MIAFESLLLMLAAAVVLLVAARRTGIPYPTLLALAGAALALARLPMPFTIEPSLILALFVAPVLVDAAFDTSVRDLHRNWRPVASLVLIAVGLTTVAVAAVVHALVPGLPWAAAIALGAIVAPPDAAAATAVLRQLRLPHRLSVILEGESLLNDASALLVYRLAVTAAVGDGGFRFASVAPAFLLSVVGSVIAGPLIALFWARFVRGFTDAPTSIIVQFVGSFGIWVLAERLGLSPILTVATYAMTISRTGAERTPANMRIPSFAVWETAVVVLNVLAFMLIGLELGPVIAAAPKGELARWAATGAAVLGTAVLTRMVWVLLDVSLARRRLGRAGVALPTTWRSGLLVGWCGMRGIVTVASALALPLDFPERGQMLFIAFAVTLGTLLIQGLTLRPLVLALRLRDDGSVDREVREARVAIADAALAALGPEAGRDAEWLREELAVERRIAADATDGDGRPVLPAKVLRAQILAARRDRLIALRHEGAIGDAAFHRLEEELDYADMAVATRT